MHPHRGFAPASGSRGGYAARSGVRKRRLPPLARDDGAPHTPLVLTLSKGEADPPDASRAPARNARQPMAVAPSDLVMSLSKGEDSPASHRTRATHTGGSPWPSRRATRAT
ncbi:MAG: hypothetical protein AMXMBFR23_17540 [Chloroflexota bacterium]